MKIKRLEIGITRMGESGKVTWDEPLVSADVYNCGCHHLGIWIWYFIWLSDECYYPCKDPECECKD